jgi:tetratricopeptide (TPR) repeat protein
VGTEGYLPLEGPGTPQADIFALGRVLYEAVTGLDRRRFPDLPADLREWPERHVLFELNPILLKACASDTRNRYASAQQIEADLALLRQGKSIRHLFRWRKRLAFARNAGLAVLILGVVAVVCLAAWNQYASRYDISANPEVNNLVRQGFRSAESETPDRLRQAENDFQDAIKLDPTFVPAHWGLFQVAINKGEWNWDAQEQAHQHIRALADKLKAIGPNRAESHIAAAFIGWLDWKFAEALAEDRKAMRTRAASIEGRSAAYNVYGFHLMQTGHPDEALAAYLKAKPLNPTSPVVLHHLGHFYFARGEFEKALKYYEDAIKVEPRHTAGHYWKARVYEETGNFLGALDEFDEMDRLNGRTNGLNETLRRSVQQDPVSGYWSNRLDLALKHPANVSQYYYIATLYARRGDTTNAYDYLKKACEKHAFSQGPLFDPCWDKSDTNFQAIVRGIGLLQ